MEKMKLWLRAATPEEREALAELSRVSVNYLYQMAGGHRRNPKVGLAMRIHLSSTEMFHRNPKLPLINMIDLIPDEELFVFPL